MIVPLLLFAAGLLLLLKGAEVTVEGAEGLAARLGVSPAFIGFTVVAFGTSLPELAVTIEAFSGGAYGIGIGNIVGSNIANMALILGLYALLQPQVCCLQPIRFRPFSSLLLLLLATAVFVVLAFRGIFDTLSGIVLLLTFVVVLASFWKSGDHREDPAVHHRSYPFLFTVAGLFAVILGAHLLLRGAVEIAAALNISPFVIGVSMVAVGTSLPELATSVIAAVKKSPGVAVGNIIGSNIFNLLFIAGLNSLYFTIPAPDTGTILALSAFTLAVLPLFLGNRLVTRIWGALLLVFYGLYIVALF